MFQLPIPPNLPLLFSLLVVSDSLWYHGLQAGQASLPLTISRSLFTFMSTASATPSSHLILRCPLLLLPSIFTSIRDFPSESAIRFRWPKSWSFRLHISPSNKYSGLISFKIDWFDLFTVQGTLKSILQGHSLKASIPWCSAFSTAQLSHPYLTTGKTTVLTITDLCCQSHVSIFQHTAYVCQNFPAKNQSSPDFMAAATVCSDFRAQDEEICHFFHILPFCVPWSNEAGCCDLRF